VWLVFQACLANAQTHLAKQTPSVDTSGELAKTAASQLDTIDGLQTTNAKLSQDLEQRCAALAASEAKLEQQTAATAKQAAATQVACLQAQQNELVGSFPAILRLLHQTSVHCVSRHILTCAFGCMQQCMHACFAKSEACAPHLVCMDAGASVALGQRCRLWSVQRDAHGDCWAKACTCSVSLTSIRLNMSHWTSLLKAIGVPVTEAEGREPRSDHH
jgi:hypothetical protein